MDHKFTDEQIINLNEYDFNRDQIERLEALALNFNLYLDDIYRDIIYIIDAYPPEPPDPPNYPDFEIRISNEMLIRLLENEYSFEEIESLLEHNFIDIDFEWLLTHPNILYEDVYHLLEDGWSFDDIKNDIEHNQQDDDDDEPDMGGKRRKPRTRQRQMKQSKGKTRRRNQSKRKTIQRKQTKGRRKQRKTRTTRRKH